MIFYVDIDETICTRPKGESAYEHAEPIYHNIAKINALYDRGHTIVYWTARGSRTGEDWRSLTLSQLDQWGAKYHELRLDKPYYDMLIDDKAINIEQV